jgi:rhodanese-related sulfurtransferase
MTPGVALEATVQDLVADEDPNKLIIDVREPMETMHGTVEGAWLVPLGQLASVVDEIDDDANVYLICRSGNRSGIAAGILTAAGKRDAKNVVGGMMAWTHAGLPVADAS